MQSSKDRRPYLNPDQSVIDQTFLDTCASVCSNKLEMIAIIETPTGFIYASDRNKYVGSTFYEALVKFPSMTRTLGEWLAPSIQFGQLTLEVSNADGRFSHLLPGGGADYAGFVGRSIEVKLGLNQNEATYRTLFKGKVSEIGGLSRSIKSFTLTARDLKDQLSSVSFPQTVLSKTVYPNLGDSLEGALLPVIYGDWTTSLLESSRAGVQPLLTNFLSLPASASAASPLNNLHLRASGLPLSYLDSSSVYLKRSDLFFLVDAADVVHVNLTDASFEIVQNSGNTRIITYNADGTIDKEENFVFEKDDTFYVQVRGISLSGYDDNIVSQVYDILVRFGGLSASDFDLSSWNYFRDQLSGVKARVFENESQNVLEYALSMLEQVRLEMAVNRDLKLFLSSLAFEDWPSKPQTLTLTKNDIVKDSFSTGLDTRNHMTKIQGVYNYLPVISAQAFRTAVCSNDAAQAFIGGKEIAKEISFPNLVDKTVVTNQVKGILRLASGFFDVVTFTCTWRALLVDIGDIILMNAPELGMDQVPILVRDITYNPEGLSITIAGWSLAMLPYPGYTPGYVGTTGGYAAVITES